MGKTSGFERMYARVTKLYFGGMARHLADMRPTLRPGAQLAYVVGDQASYLRIMIRTGQLLADIAQALGYEVGGLIVSNPACYGNARTTARGSRGFAVEWRQRVLPVQAKGHSDKIGIVQIEQDIAVCAAKFPKLICRPIAAQFMDGGVIAMFEFEETESGIGISAEKHYRLVRPEEVSAEELDTYQRRSF